jgi:hypothetical protein
MWLPTSVRPSGIRHITHPDRDNGGDRSAVRHLFRSPYSLRMNLSAAEFMQ